MEELSAHFANILKECLSRNMQLPFVVCSASPNGSIVALRYFQSDAGGLDCEVLAEHMEGMIFRVPVTCMILDQAGEAVRVTIDRGGVTFH